MKDADKKSDEGILEEAKKRFKQCVDDNEQERRKQLEDLVFCDVEQWPEEVRAARENDVNGPRPCLTIDKINQYITQVVNDMRQNKPGIKARPVDDEADPKTAKVFQELIRRIEDDSRADIAYLTAGESAVKIGEGYFRFITDFVDPDSFNQEILFKPVKDTFSVYLGPHVMPDGSDAEYGFVLEDMPKERFKREFPKAKSGDQDFTAGVGRDDRQYWTNGEMVRVCEYFYFDYTKKRLYLLEDGNSLYKEEYEQAISQGITPPAIVKERETTAKSVKWCKLSAIEILEKRDWAGKYIPIVKVEGKCSQVKGKKVSKGLVRQAKDSLRAYNYWFSTITEKLALSPKMPLIGAVGQFETHKDKWARANTQNYPFLEYDPVEVNGMALPAPQRQAPAPLEAAMIQHLQIIEHDIQTSLGMFKASVGQADPQQSGRALQALQHQTDTGTFHFPDNMAISIRHAGRILIDLIPKIMDTAQVVRILGEDGEPGSAEIDPNQQEAAKETQDMMGNIKTIYNLGVGKYDVTATVGPSYSTKRMEQADMMLQVMQNQPELIQKIGDLLFKSFDWPMSDKIAERLAPPGTQDAEGKEIPPQIQAAMAQIQQGNQMLDQKAQALSQAEQEIDKKAMDVERKSVEVFVKESQVKTEAAKVALEKYAQELAAREQSLSQEDPAQIEVYKAELEAQTKKHIAEIDRETKLQIALLGTEGVTADTVVNIVKLKHEADLQAALLEAEDREDGLSSQDDIKRLIEAMNQNISGLLDSHRATQETMLNAMMRPKKTTAVAVKQPDGNWVLTKEEV